MGNAVLGRFRVSLKLSDMPVFRNARILGKGRCVSRAEEKGFPASFFLDLAGLQRASESDRGLYTLEEIVSVFRYDTVHYDGGSELVFGVESKSIFATGADKIVYKVHSSSGFQPSIINIGFFALDQDVGSQAETAN